MEPTPFTEETRSLLREAMSQHTAGRIDAALSTARRAIKLAPSFAEAHAYLGNTLVTRQRQFADGLAALRHAVELAPEDATILYTTGWCEEYVANALERPRHRHQVVDQDAGTLYSLARTHFLRALDVNTDPLLKGDIEDMLDVVAATTGKPWEPDAVVGSTEPDGPVGQAG
jgi:tetratricopeptide (TPR) repeat protein